MRRKAFITGVNFINIEFLRQNKEFLIKFYAKLGKSASEAYKLMKQVYDDSCLSRSNVFVRHKGSLDGSDTVEDDQRNRRSISSRTPEIIDKVRNFVANDRCASLRMMADSLNINKETIRTILHEDLGKAKV
ncbi:protein GVQW3 [Trichonephila clavipes]|uniref:Protein GVQW3 n=1 Tax=Trichonephila clavipes TaxID=2585209 RepID=A0A8X6S7V0_TRICX|nr:protein GVQW3 [Trichonephila clavipes]